jgi:hypothetical protein
MPVELVPPPLSGDASAPDTPAEPLAVPEWPEEQLETATTQQPSTKALIAAFVRQPALVRPIRSTQNRR